MQLSIGGVGGRGVGSRRRLRGPDLDRRLRCPKKQLKQGLNNALYRRCQEPSAAVAADALKDTQVGDAIAISRSLNACSPNLRFGKCRIVLFQYTNAFPCYFRKVAAAFDEARRKLVLLRRVGRASCSIAALGVAFFHCAMLYYASKSILSIQKSNSAPRTTSEPSCILQETLSRCRGRPQQAPAPSTVRGATFHHQNDIKMIQFRVSARGRVLWSKQSWRWVLLGTSRALGF